jgi:phage gp37-like protein
MSVENLIGDLELALVKLLRYGLLTRYAAAADLTALAATVGQSDGALRYVTSVSALFEWYPYISTTPNGTTIIASSAASLPLGRWIKVVTPWTFGAGGPNLSSQSAIRDTNTQAVIPCYLENVEAYTRAGDDEALERLQGKTPSILVSFQGDDPKPDSDLPGTFYKNRIAFKLLIVTENHRGSPSATQGSRVSTDKSGGPGSYRIIGDLRRLICGVSPTFKASVPGVERLEIGPCNLAFEDDDRRQFIFHMDVYALTSFSIDDQDLVDMTIQAQPELTDCAPAVEFDPDNYLASGAGLSEGLGVGFTRTVEAAVVVIGGSAVASTDTSVTLPASSTTWRDLGTDGTWTFVSVTGWDYTQAEPDVTTDALRIARTTTDDAGVVSDKLLCSYSTPFGDPISVG